MLCSPWSLFFSTHPCVCLQWVVTEQACAMFSMVVVPLYTTLVVCLQCGRTEQACAMFLHGRVPLYTTLVSVYSGTSQSRRVLCSPWLTQGCVERLSDLENIAHACVCLQWVVTEQACAMFSMVACHSTPPLCLSAVGRHRAGVCYVLHGRCASLHHPCVCLQWVVTEQACAMFSMVVVPLYTTLVSVYSGSSQSRRVLCSPWSLCLSTPPLCLSTVGRHRAGVCYVLHGRCASLHHPCVCLQWVVTEQACAMFSRMVCSPTASLHHPGVCLHVGRHRQTGVCYVLHGRCASLHHPCVCLQWVVTEQACAMFSMVVCLSTPPLCLSAVGRHSLQACAMFSMGVVPLYTTLVSVYSGSDTEQVCAMFSMVVVPLYTPTVSVYSGSLQSRRVLCSPWSLCLSTPPLCLSTVGQSQSRRVLCVSMVAVPLYTTLCLSTVGRHRAGVCYVLHGRCASLHHPCVCLQWVVTEQACAMFSMVAVPLYTTLVSFYSGSSQSRRVLCSPWSLCLSTPPLCLSTVGRHRAGVCYVLHGRCASLHHPCVCLQWVVTEQACAMFSMVGVPLYTTLVSVCSGSSQSRRVLCSPWSLCLSTPPLCLSTVGRHRAGVCYVLHGRCASLHHPCVCLQWVVTHWRQGRVLCSPWSLCLSTPPLCLWCRGSHRPW